MNVLIVGLGSIAKKHIESIKKLVPSPIFYALRSQKNANNEEGIINLYDLSHTDKFDFAIISNPTSEHAEAISRIFPLNIPLFIEKPLFSSLNEDELVERIVNKQIPTYVACNLRFLDSLIHVKDSIADKRINEVNVYCGSYLPAWRPNVDFRKVYSANKEMGGGVHIDLIHEIDYVTWIFGFPKNVRKQFENNSSLNISAYDYANYLMLYDKFSVNLVLNYYRKSPKRILEIVCEDGEFVVDLLRNEVFWNGESVFASEQKVVDTYVPQMKFFLENVLKGNEVNKTNTISEAYNILKICLEN